MYGEDGSGLTNEIIMETARKAVHPFTLEFESLDWWTVYQIGQRVAETYVDGHVILAGGRMSILVSAYIDVLLQTLLTHTAVVQRR